MAREIPDWWVTKKIILNNIPGGAIRFNNFRGVAQPPYNPEGKRNFSLEIADEELARKLAEDGWNIKFSEPNEDGVVYAPRLPVQVKYNKAYPDLNPKIKMDIDGHAVDLSEETVGDLDDLEILNIRTITIRPYNCEIPNKDGSVDRYTTAYVEKLRVEVAKDLFYD